MRLSEAKKDHYRKLAKEEGYSSRASYKLIQIQAKYRVLKPNSCVIDFGCAPGGWLEVASKEVGDGYVIGIDKKPVKTQLENTKILTIDVYDSDAESKILAILPRKVDVVLSDLAPNISGIWEVDHAKQIDLCRRVIEFLPKILTRGGSIVLKVFEGPDLKEFVNQVAKSFEYLNIAKPSASRSASSELYVVGKNYSG
ncbi:MAG: RlmE family RNA methyltransferase [Thaumarchaeota archaeon]|nr:RlmE family RNA methyltransferase [Nitrososphaerota archaeon]